MTIMVTGGAGYIGSHTCVELIGAGRSVVVFDNFCNSKVEVLSRIERIAGKRPELVKGDVRDREALASALVKYRCDGVIHFAGLKAVGDSVKQPISYYENNVAGSLALIEAMKQANVGKLVFSSSATVYGDPLFLPLTEDHPKRPYSPYGRTKLVVEDILGDLASSSDAIKIAVLRYFNPVGSHESGLIGEDPLGVPGNLMPFIAQVAVGRRPYVNVFGNDYDTHDGTGVRDYVHVMDLAAGHLRALERLEQHSFIKVNLGTGQGSSVLDLIQTFSKACGKEIPLRFGPRRDGDVASYYASVCLARDALGWHALRGLHEMCEDVWNWQKANPNGYSLD
ncbi:UDP-glucose 4-epimerase [Nitrobacteraceae bacterium AZCC 2146]